jgi:hypothetical protein
MRKAGSEGGRLPAKQLKSKSFGRAPAAESASPPLPRLPVFAWFAPLNFPQLA